MNRIAVQGHSGCDIEVSRENGLLYIYKSTRDPKYFKRLILQAEKQQKASIPQMQFIRVPEILSIIESESEVRIKMDYVYSRNFIEYFEQAGFEQISYLIGALKMYIEREIEESELKATPSEIVKQKFEDVCDKTRNNKYLQKSDFKGKIEEILSKSTSLFNSLPSSLILPIGTCHGDLTFSNILFNGNNYYLIDFLDSFIESPLLDIVKIRQDTAWLWSRLMYSGSCDNIRLKIIFGKIDHQLDSYFYNKYDWYRNYYAIMQILNFLRILQYAKEVNVIEFLISSINRQLNEI